MGYRLKKGKSVEKNFRRVAREQVGKALSEIGNPEIDRHETVHQVRKRCKKLRGLIRLVRPAFKDYKRENGVLRDAAGELSFVRDAQSIIESLDDLAGHYAGHVDDSLFEPVREELALRRREVAEERDLVDGKLAEFQGSMEQLGGRIGDWVLAEDDFAAVEGGLRKTYDRGRKAYARAYEQPSTERFHEWRKRVKYHWYHSRLLRELWPDMLKARRRAGDRLSDLLGDDHDLAVLQQTLAEEPQRFGGSKRLQAIFGLIERRRLELQAQARPLGALLYAENDRKLAKRLGVYWQVWLQGREAAAIRTAPSLQ